MNLRIEPNVTRRGLAGSGAAGRGTAWFGRVDGRKPGFDSLATRAQRWAGQGCGGVGHGQAWIRMAWQGVEGGWQAPRFEPSAPAALGGARHGWAGLGMEWLGRARRGTSPATAVDHELAPWSSPASGRDSLPGLARYGDAGRGAVRQGLNPVTAVDCVISTQPSPATRRDKARPGWAGPTKARRGLARPGQARPGTEPVTAVGREHVSRPSAAPGRYRARYGGARHGTASSGPARRGLAMLGVVPVTAWGWGLAPQPWTAPGRYVDGQGTARPGRVQRDRARLGRAGHGAGGRSSARFDSAPPTLWGGTWQGPVWQGSARLCEARHGSPRRGMAYTSGRPISEFDSPTLTFHGMERLGTAGNGRAWRGMDHHFYLEFRMFEVKGDQAEWRMIYAKVLSLDVDDVLKYTDLDEVLGRDFLHDRSPVYRAITELEKANARTLANVRGVGYRVAAASEHEGLARAHHQRSRRQMRKAVNKATSADRAALTPDQRKRIDGLEMSLRQHAQMIRRLERNDEQRQAEIKNLRRDTSANVAELSERVDRLADLLERHGVKPETS